MFHSFGSPLKESNVSPTVSLDKTSNTGLSFLVPANSVPKRKKKIEPEIERLTLKHFSATPKLCFENVFVESTKIIHLYVDNLQDDVVNVEMKKFPFDKGFDVTSTKFAVDPFSNFVVEISWTPSEDGNVREVIMVETSNNLRLQVILLGSAKLRKPKKTKKVANPKSTKENRFSIKPNRDSKKIVLKTAKILRTSRKSPKIKRTVTENILESPISSLTYTKDTDNTVDLSLKFDKSPEFNDKQICPERDFPVTPLRRQTFVKDSISPENSLVEHTLESIAEFPVTPLRRQTFVQESMSTTESLVDQDVFQSDIRLVTFCKQYPGIQKEDFNDSLNQSCGDNSIFDDSLEAGSAVNDDAAPIDPKITFNIPDTVLSADESKKRKKWDVPPRVNFCLDVMESVEEFNHETFNIHRKDSDPSFMLEEPASFSLKRCSTGLRYKVPPLRVPHNLSSVEGPTKELFGSQSESLRMDRLSSETFTSSPPPSMKNCLTQCLEPIDSDDASVSLASDEVNRLPIISQEKIIGFVESPRKKFKKPFAMPRKSPAKSRTRNLSVKTGVRSPKKPTKTEVLRRKIALQKSASLSKSLNRSTFGRPQKNLMLMKRNKSHNIPQHPNPYAAKNMFYDEKWMDKQERGFTRWLNFFLTPPEDLSTTANTTKVDAAKLWVECKRNTSHVIEKAPTKEDLSLKSYTARRRLNKLRRAACMLFQSEPVVRVISKVEAELEKDRIVVRSDCAMHADLGIKQRILDMLLCYNSLWLRIGLETIYGEVLPLQSNSDVLGISRFIVRRLLNSPDIASEYAHPTVPHLYKSGYDKAMKKFTLKKFLLLIYFLDRGKLTRLIDHDPCLFCFDASFKSSRDVLLSFSRDYLQGEGDLTKHLSYLGFVVSHEQKFLDEFDYAIQNIAVDLRCGIRLMKITSLLVKKWTLMYQARVPAISKLQKIHNIGVAMKTLEDSSMKLMGGITPRDITEGHREKTLSLLWQMIFKFQIEVMLKKTKIIQETEYLKKSLSVNKKLQSLSKIVPQGVYDIDDSPMNIYYNCDVLKVLLQWVQFVCAHYNMNIENFTVSFSDGRALCYLIHHYHPKLLPLASIHQETSQTSKITNADDSSSDESLVENWNKTYSPTTGKCPMEKYLANERKNFKLIFEKLEELGGIPILTKSADMSNTIPDEKVIITLVAYLNARLMDLGEEIKASRVIQLAWKRFTIKKLNTRKEVERQAALSIQKAFRAYIAKRELRTISKATLILQSKLRGYICRKRYNKALNSARTIQVWFRRSRQMNHNRRSYLKLRENVVKMQRLCRANQDRRNYLRKRETVIVIQSHFRGFAQRRRYVETKMACLTLENFWVILKRGRGERERFLQIKRSAILIQKWYRGVAVKRRYQDLRKGVVYVQACFRRNLAQRRYSKLKQATKKIEDWFWATKQMRDQKRSFLTLKQSAVEVQSWWRSVVARKQYILAKSSAVVIQSWWRMKMSSSKFDRFKMAAVVLQRSYRHKVQVDRHVADYTKTRLAVIYLQSLVRRKLARIGFLEMKKSAVVIQACFRQYRIRKQFLAYRNAVATVQRRYRALRLGRVQLRRYHIARGAAIFLQSHVKRVQARKRYVEMRNSCVLIQSAVRGFIARRRYKEIVSAATCIQRCFRATKLAVEQFRKYHTVRAATIIVQSMYRMRVQRKKYLEVIRHIVKVQATIRGHLRRREFVARKEASLKIQIWFRSCAEASRIRDEFIEKRCAVIVTQSYVRMKMQRREYTRQKMAAILIQKNVRCLMGRKKYLLIRRAVSILQHRYRSALLARAVRQEYLLQRISCIKLQAVVRGWLVRRNLMRRDEAAAILQAAYRALKGRREFLELRRATCIVQNRWRATILARRITLDYLNYRRTVIMIQSQFRGFMARKEYLRNLSCIVRIQSHIRRYQAQKNFIDIRQATEVLQRYWRATLMSKKCQAEYGLTRGKIITCQSCVRGWIIRRDLKRKNGAAVVIQAGFRGLQMRLSFLELKRAACILQQKLQATLTARQHRLKYISYKNGVVKIQALFRGVKARRKYLQLRSNVVCIQSHFRRYQARKNFRRIVNAVETLQDRWRAVLVGRRCCSCYHDDRAKIIECQAIVRGWITRRSLRRLERAAIVIQAGYRGTIQRRQYLKLQQATLTLQNRWRATLLARQQTLIYNKCRNAAVKIQACFKCHKSRKEYLRLRSNVVCIQSHIRRYQAQKIFRINIGAVKTLQYRWRAVLVGRWCRSCYHTDRAKIIECQAVVRGWITRKSLGRLERAVLVIQAGYHGTIQRRRYLKLRQAALTLQNRWRATLLTRQQTLSYNNCRNGIIKIQSCFKCFKARREYLRLRSNVVCIQSHIRQYQVRQNYTKTRQAVIVLQNHWRAAILGKKGRLEYTNERKKIISCQAYVRGYLARSSYGKVRSAVCKIQSSFKGRKQRHRYLQLRQNVCLVQNWYRSISEQRRVRWEFLDKRRSCVVLQSHFRRFLAVKEYTKVRSDVIVIQSLARGVLARKMAAEKLNSIKIIQGYCRGYLQTRQRRLEFLAMKSAAVIIQANIRRYLAKRLLRNHKAAVKVQSFMKMQRHRRNYQIKRSQIIVVQSLVRKFLSIKQTKQIQERHRAATFIQIFYRSCLIRRCIKEAEKRRSLMLQRFAAASFYNLKAMVIQRCYRNSVVRAQARKELHSIVLIQSWVRARLQRIAFLMIKHGFSRLQEMYRDRLTRRNESTVVIQAAVRSWLGRKYVNKWKKSIVTIQAHWRGYAIRSSKRYKRLTKVRQRLLEANKKATENMKLYQRTECALDYLLECKSITTITAALQHLDVVTRLSPICCQKMAECNAINTIYKLVQSCNRSLPHMEVIKCSVNILLNLAKFDKTVQEVRKVSASCGTLLELMSIYREKGEVIFTKCATLLWILAQNAQYANEFKSVAKNAEKVQSLHFLIERQHNRRQQKQIQKVKIESVIHPKSKHATLQKKAMSNYLKIQPDWILGKKHFREFTDTYHSISLVLDLLSLSKK